MTTSAAHPENETPPTTTWWEIHVEAWTNDLGPTSLRANTGDYEEFCRAWADRSDEASDGLAGWLRENGISRGVAWRADLFRCEGEHRGSMLCRRTLVETLDEGTP